MNAPRNETPPLPEWVLRVRWTRDGWTTATGRQRWRTKFHAHSSGAVLAALRLADSGARVEWCWLKVSPAESVQPSEDLGELLDYLRVRRIDHHRL